MEYKPTEGDFISGEHDTTLTPHMHLVVRRLITGTNW